MSQVQVITTQVSALDAARAETVTAVMRGYGATKVYAETLTQYLGEGWFKFEHNDKTEEAKPTLEEGNKFRKALKDAGHTNPSVVWTRVRNEGRKLTEDDKPEGEASESAGTKEVRSLKLRMIEELSTLHKAAKREEGKNNLGKAEAEAATYIASALKALGVDLTMVQ